MPERSRSTTCMPMAYSGAHNDLLDAAASLPLLGRLCSGLPSGKEDLLLGDISEQAWPFVAAVMARSLAGKHPIWFVCRDVRTQEEFASELGAWINQAILFPDLEIPSAGLGLPDPERASERLALLGRLASGECVAPVITASQWEELVPSRADLTGRVVSLSKGWKGSPGKLVVELEEGGYERVAQVTRRGEFVLRGGILDFYSWQQELPWRKSTRKRPTLRLKWPRSSRATVARAGRLRGSPASIR